MRFLLLVMMLFCAAPSGWSQVNAWYAEDSRQQPTLQEGDRRYSLPTEFKRYRLDQASIVNALLRSPDELSMSPRYSPLVVSFPTPDGELRDFHMVSVKMVEDELQEKFPHLRAYIGVDPVSGSKVYCNTTSNQDLFAVVNTPNMTYYIDPFSRQHPDQYVVYDMATYESEARMLCDQHLIENGEIVDLETEILDNSALQVFNERSDPISLRTYRLAVSADHTFSQAHGGTVSTVLDAIMTVMVRVNAIFETDAAVRMILVGNNDRIIFLDEAADPFRDIPVGDQAAFLSRNPGVIDGAIGLNAYDVGHVFNGKANANSGQGIGQLGSVCTNGQNFRHKASGSSAQRVSGGVGRPFLDPFAISIVSHEFGHQFNCRHTMFHCHNANEGGLDDTGPPSAYEIGSGITVMSYNGICSPSTVNIPGGTRPFFHTNSVESILNFSRGSVGGSCGQTLNLGNNTPDVVAADDRNLHIPINTAFRLTASASDVNGDVGLTYCWEQYQSGRRTWAPDQGGGNWDFTSPIDEEPLFRGFDPTPDSVRYFPRLSNIVSGFTSRFEQIPNYERPMVFRVTVRDNAADIGGGASWATYEFDTHDAGLPGQFGFTNFDERDTVNSFDELTLTWDVWDTDLTPVSTPFMDIYMSIDGGDSFPFLVKSSTPNDGSTTVQVPNVESESARFMIVGHDQIFLDVNDGRIFIERDSSEEMVRLDYTDEYLQVCAPEVLQIPLSTESLLGSFDGNVQLSVENLPAGVTASFSNDNPAIGEDVTLTVDFTNAQASSTDDLEIRYVPDGMPAQTALLEMNVQVNSFDDLALLSPADDSQLSTGFPLMEWQGAAQAQSYTLQIATFPTFEESSIVYEEAGITETSRRVPPDAELPAGDLYFWRVIPNNNCGDFIGDEVFVFAIQPESCETYCSTEPTINIVPSGAQTYSMTISTGAPVTPVNLSITNFRGNHDRFTDLRVALRGPDGTEVAIIGPICPLPLTFDMNFNSEVVGATPTCFNFDEQLTFNPLEPLSSLYGITGSEYTLIVEDTEGGGGNGGEWEGWCLELCAPMAVTAPELLTNQVLSIGNLTTNNLVSSTLLNVSHPDFGPSELLFTIVAATNAGTVFVDGTPLQVGGQFTMQDIIDGRVAYNHEVASIVNDGFDFVVTSPNNGLLFTPRFSIDIASSNYNVLPEGDALVIFPNPTREVLNIHLQSSELQVEGIRLYNAIGKLVRVEKVSGSNQLQIDMGDLAAGVYLIEVEAKDYAISRKVIKL